MSIRIAAVVVTFNRLEKLKKALVAYETQERPVDDLIIVDNCSNDGTKDFLKEWATQNSPFVRHVVYLNENMGGAGGFHDGCDYALKLNSDWIFVADDDAYPAKDAFKRFEAYVENHNTDNVSAICSSVLSMDGKVAYHHRCNYTLKYGCKIEISNSKEEDYQKKVFRITTFSYVGTFMKSNSLRKVGLCNKKYFIYYDDTEHSMRMLKDGCILCVPEIKLYHDDAVADNKLKESARLWRLYYGYRNEIYSLLHHYPLAGIRTALAILITVQLNTSIGREEKKMFRVAIFDAIRGKLGKHKVYKP